MHGKVQIFQSNALKAIPSDKTTVLAFNTIFFVKNTQTPRGNLKFSFSVKAVSE